MAAIWTEVPLQEAVGEFEWCHVTELVEWVVNDSIWSQSGRHLCHHENLLLWLGPNILIDIFSIVSIVIEESTIDSLQPIHHMTGVCSLFAAYRKCDICELFVSHIVTDIAPVNLVCIETSNHFNSWFVALLETNSANLEMTDKLFGLEPFGQLLKLSFDEINHTLNNVLRLLNVLVPTPEHWTHYWLSIHDLLIRERMEKVIFQVVKVFVCQGQGEVSWVAHHVFSFLSKSPCHYIPNKLDARVLVRQVGNCEEVRCRYCSVPSFEHLVHTQICGVG